jgi:hypothetical protein
MCVVATIAFQGVGPAGAGAQEPTPELMARVMELAQPGPEHAVLTGLAGEWDQTVRIWPEPGAAPMELTGRAVNRMILGNRFLESNSTYSIGVPGESLESVSLLGFDRRHEEFTLVGLDTQGTYWVTARGTRDDSGTIVMRGTDDEPVIGHTQVYDFRITIDGPDRYVVEIVFHDEMHTRGGGPFRMVEVVHTRSAS